MSLLSNLVTDETIANERDSVGSGGVLDSALYNFNVALAYIAKSAGGALGLTLHLKTDAGRELRQTLWMTSGTAKGCKNYYEDKQGEKQFLPGWNTINAVCLLGAGIPLTDIEPEKKKIMLYSYDAKAEVPTEVVVLTELTGKTITMGVQEVRENKTALNEALGKRVPINEERKSNQINKVFRTRDHLTVAEITAGVEEATFYSAWDKKNTGVMVDKYKEVAQGPAGAKAGAPAAKSLFA